MWNLQIITKGGHAIGLRDEHLDPNTVRDAVEKAVAAGTPLTVLARTEHGGRVEGDIWPDEICGWLCIEAGQIAPAQLGIIQPPIRGRQ